MKSSIALGLAFLLSVELQAQQFLRLKSYQSALSEALQRAHDILKKGG